MPSRASPSAAQSSARPAARATAGQQEWTDLLGHRLRFAQPGRGYRVAIDPVLLAAATAAEPGQSVLDAGCGAGAAALCLAARAPSCGIVGVERDPTFAELARRNVAANDFGARVEIVEQDIAVFASANGSRFDQVLCNPPFYPVAAHTASPNRGKAAAHGEGDLGLDGWIAAASACLKAGGRLTLIHRTDRLAEILAALGRRFGAARICPLWPKAGAPSKRIIVTAVRGRKTPPALLPGLILHAEGGAFTPEAERILRDAAPLALFDPPD